MKRVTAKLGNMRKPRDWLVRPTDDGRIMVQAENAIGLFDFRTRQGVLNTKGGYFPHLNPMLGAKPFEFPAEFVSACLEACPALDSQTVLGGGAVIAHNTIQIQKPEGTV